MRVRHNIQWFPVIRYYLKFIGIQINNFHPRIVHNTSLIQKRGIYFRINFFSFLNKENGDRLL
ncbi:hypothetical protein BGX16_1457 [Hallerella succinigenes]|uniref:Uncharacterized protein n=1 Tax=Hallerella succinigenes TaxID=1896222 RepID=A0A2M9A6Y4_9BACT|nr:hypothetical protein BGX16_1457 [Hallerella succinigenes]